MKFEIVEATPKSRRKSSKAPKRYKRWTMREEAELFRLRAEGVPYHKISRIIGRSVPSMHQRMHALSKSPAHNVASKVTVSAASTERKQAPVKPNELSPRTFGMIVGGAIGLNLVGLLALILYAAL